MILDHFWAKMFKSETTSFHKFSQKVSESLKMLDIRLWEVGAKRRLNGTYKENYFFFFIHKKNFFLPQWFYTIFEENFQIWDHFFPLLFPTDSESLKNLDIQLRQVGAKRRLNGTPKSEQTHGHTDKHTGGHLDL